MNILNAGRFGMGAALTGTMKYCIAGAAQHASQRVQFGKSLKEFTSIQNKIGDMACRLYATESVCALSVYLLPLTAPPMRHRHSHLQVAYYVAGAMDAGAKDYLLEAAVGKIFASENAWHVADETVQIYGGTGFMEDAPWAVSI
jgi:very long chain acyl-CoA dehydrogenase